jgi:general secretion pathway protein G
MKQDEKIKGFTLIEILVSILIFTVITTIVVVNFRTANRRARDSRREADLETIRTALELYREDNDQYPDEDYCDSSIGSCGSDCPCSPAQSDWNGTIESELEPDYITDLPVDPKNDSSYYYAYEPLCNQSGTVCGVSKDCSGSGDCCAYELSVLLETTGADYEVCSP